MTISFCFIFSIPEGTLLPLEYPWESTELFERCVKIKLPSISFAKKQGIWKGKRKWNELWNLSFAQLTNDTINIGLIFLLSSYLKIFGLGRSLEWRDGAQGDLVKVPRLEQLQLDSAFGQFGEIFGPQRKDFCRRHVVFQPDHRHRDSPEELGVAETVLVVHRAKEDRAETENGLAVLAVLLVSLPTSHDSYWLSDPTWCPRWPFPPAGPSTWARGCAERWRNGTTGRPAPRRRRGRSSRWSRRRRGRPLPQSRPPESPSMERRSWPRPNRS